MPVTSGTITAPASLRSEGDRLRIGISDRDQIVISDRLRRNTHFIERHVTNRTVLLQLAANWVTMAQALHSARIAHGDLQDGNVLVVGSQLKLVDYDGMYVPSLNGRLSNEIGQPNFQLPQRTPADFGPYLDNFSEWVVLVSILALVAEPRLWQTFQGGDKCLLFRKRDFEAPDQSSLFKCVERCPDQRVAAVTNLFRTFLCLSASRVPAIDDPSFSEICGGAKSVAVSSGSDWISDHLPRSGTTPPSHKVVIPPVPAPSSLGVDWILDFTAPPPVPIQPKTSLLEERLILLVSALAIVAVVLLTPLSIGVLACVAVLIANAVFLRHSYLQLPELAEAIAQRDRAKELQTELDRVTEDMQKHDKARQQVRKDAVDSLKEISGRRADLAAEEKRKAEEIRDKFGSILALTLKEKQQLDRSEMGEVGQLQKTLGSKIADLRGKIAGSASAESAEIAAALKTAQDGFIQGALARARVLDASIAGIGTGFKMRLFQYGFQIAADVSYYAVQRVPGIGKGRAAAIAVWRQGVENLAKHRMPKSLGKAEEQSIHRKHAANRDSLERELHTSEASFQSLQSEIQQRYGATRSQLQATISKVEGEMQSALTTSNSEFRRKAADFAELELEAKELAGKRAITIEQQIEQVTRKLAQIQWKIGKLGRELTRYANITQMRFVRRVILWQ